MTSTMTKHSKTYSYKFSFHHWCFFTRKPLYIDKKITSQHTLLLYVSLEEIQILMYNAASAQVMRHCPILQNLGRWDFGRGRESIHSYKSTGLRDDSLFLIHQRCNINVPAECLLPTELSPSCCAQPVDFIL